jgi:hypothetical protein
LQRLTQARRKRAALPRCSLQTRPLPLLACALPAGPPL